MDHIVIVSGVSNERIVLQLLHLVQNADVEVTRQRDKDVNFRHDVWTPSKHACRAQKKSFRQRKHEHQNQRRAKLQAGHIDLNTTVSHKGHKPN